jgi:polyribonucleotide nucleotidyltransferase
LLPRCHGSALFTRGETQSIVTATLGIAADAQRMDTLFGEGTSKFMLHYNFPGYSVGETKPMRGPGRREIGHGALARRALIPVLPNLEQYPYVIRIVSEITESNGSSSMATVCGGSLALMDAGVPLTAPVAGVAMGLMKEGSDCAILTDILGDEDHLGDMDFKVCGTEKGITALQMDIKIQGLSQEIMTQALDQAKQGRLHILGKLKESLAQPRTELSAYAPRIVTFKISTGRIKDIIGSGGKTIRSLCEVHEVKIDVSDDGTVTIAGSNAEKLNAAVAVCKSLTAEAEVGKIYNGVVKKIASFGAIVEILPGVDGLLHITQLSDKRVEDVEDIISLGDEVPVKVLEVERQTGKIKLSLKEALAEQGQRAIQ